MNTRVYVESVNLSGTVRWIGFLDGLESERAGIELDYTPLTTAHSGEYRDKQIFPCRHNCGIFIKTSKLVKSNSLKSAIEAKYIASESTDPSPPSIEIPKFPTPVFVGEEKAKKFFSSNLFLLDEISIDQTSVSFDPNTDISFLSSFTALTRLSLCGNFITSLDNIIDICRLIPTLDFLDVSSNRLSVTLGNTQPCSSNLTTLVMDDCKLVLDNFFIDWVGLTFPRLLKMSVRKNELRAVTSQFPPSLKTFSCSNPIVPVENIFGLIQTTVPNIERLDIDGIDIEQNSILSLPSLSHLHVSVSSWDTFSAISTQFSLLSSLVISSSQKSFYDSSSKSRSIIIVSLPNLVSLNHSLIRPHQRTEATKYVSSLLVKRDSVACSVIPGPIQSSLSSRAIENDPVSNKLGSAEPNKTYWTLRIKSGTDIPIRVPKSVTLMELCSLVARKISWPLKISELALAVRPPYGDESDIMLLADNSDLACVDDDWYVFTSVCDKK
jgi:hypothetical protein